MLSQFFDMDEIKYIRNDFDMAHCLASSKKRIAIMDQLDSKSIWWYIEYLCPFGYTFFDTDMSVEDTPYHIFEKTGCATKVFRPEWMEDPRGCDRMVNVEADPVFDCCVGTIMSISDDEEILNDPVGVLESIGL